VGIFFKTLLSIAFVGYFILSSEIVQSAENNKVLKLGMVDVTKVTQGSLLAKDIARKIDTTRRKFMNEIKSEETSLRKLDGELQKKRIILSPDSFADEKRKFTRKRSALNKMVQGRNQRLLEFRQNSDVFWNKSMQKAVSDVVTKHGYNLVFRYSPELVLVRPKSIDISNLVLDQLNKNVSKYTGAIPAAKTGK
jgi:Skp family chaperone for outer membrane proteins